MSTGSGKQFLAEFVANPKSVGAVAPSSHVLARRVVACVDWTGAKSILEYGPGTGVITEHILASMSPGARLVAVEINPRFAAILRERFPALTVCQDSVANVLAICQSQGIGGVDAVLSGLPWSTFSDQDQTIYLDAMMSVLKPGGKFVTFSYLQGLLLPAASRFRRKLKNYFSDVKMTKPIWKNLPPAFIYDCTR